MKFFKKLPLLSLTVITFLLFTIPTRTEFVSYIEGTIGKKQIILIVDHHRENKKIDKKHGDILVHMVTKWGNDKTTKSRIITEIHKDTTPDKTFASLTPLLKFAFKNNNKCKNADIIFADRRTWLLLSLCRLFWIDLDSMSQQLSLKYSNLYPVKFSRLEDFNNFIQKNPEYSQKIQQSLHLFSKSIHNCFTKDFSEKEDISANAFLKNMKNIEQEVDAYITEDVNNAIKRSLLQLKNKITYGRQFLEKFFKKYLSDLKLPFYQAIINCFEQNQSFNEILDIIKRTETVLAGLPDPGFLIDIFEGIKDESCERIVLVTGVAHAETLTMHLAKSLGFKPATPIYFDGPPIPDDKLHKLLKTNLDRCKCCKKFETAKNQFKVCSACKKVSYCSIKCQKKDWKTGHKKECQAKAI